MDKLEQENEQASGNTEIRRDGREIGGLREGNWRPERGEQTGHRIE
jgi:hypothetical protein